MADQTGIDYLDAAWNPIHGCRPGLPCWGHCWARRMAKRLQGAGVKGYERGFAPTFDATRLTQPLRWKKPRRIGVNFMGDTWAKGITDEQIAAIFGVMAACRQHTFVLTTKQAQRMETWFDGNHDTGRAACLALDSIGFERGCGSAFEADEWPLPNLWLGVSAMTQADADERLPHLLRCLAAVRWVSVEPMWEGIDLRHIKPWHPYHGPDGADALGGGSWGHKYLPKPGYCNHSNSPRLDWVVCGAESGPGAHPMDIAWARSLRDQCVAAKTRFYYKQGPGDAGEPFKHPCLDGRTWSEVPPQGA
jgi:protein gp37